MTTNCESLPRFRPTCCPRYGGYEWCVVARGTEPFLFWRDVCGVGFAKAVLG